MAMIGEIIGSYRITDKLGEGGMGVVYKAIDESLDRVVAIKALSQDLSGDPQLVERFRSEAKAQAHLNHTNIATGQYLRRKPSRFSNKVCWESASRTARGSSTVTSSPRT
jgi:serine/threonine protein kinase